MTKNQFEALMAWLEARINYEIDSALGYDTDYSYSDEIKARQDLYGAFGWVIK